MNEETPSYECCKRWLAAGAKRCPACDASEAHARGDKWRTHAEVARAVQRCGL